jgi:phosphoribosylaminoimidazolecarboxamide formyltransferase / IMP cyclohydrolase
LTGAYVRARDTDPKSSYGDFVAVSAPVDAELASLLRRLVCDGIVAPGYEPGTVATLSAKKNGSFLIMEADPAHRPPAQEVREVHGMRFVQPWDDAIPDRTTLDAVSVGTVPEHAVDDLVLGLLVVRHTQSNSVAYVRDGMTLGVGAGQQSRVDCVRLAGAKTDTWWLRRHPRVRTLPAGRGRKIQDGVNAEIDYLDAGPTGSVSSSGITDSAVSNGRTGSTDLAGSGGPAGIAPLTVAERIQWLNKLDRVSLASDGTLPFRDNIDHARRHGVRYIAEPGGSIRSAEVLAACQEQGIALVHTGMRLFRH